MKKFNIILILVLIILLFIIFTSSAVSEYSYYNLSSQRIIEGAGDIVGTKFKCVKNKRLLRDPVPLQKHWGLTFTVNLNQPCSGNWQQIIGVTPELYNNVGNDRRLFGAWLCPNTTNLHLRTTTVNNENAEITGCEPTLKLNIEYRIDVISNRADNNQQNIDVTVTNLKTNAIEWQITKILDAPKYSGDTNSSAYVFTTYENWDPIDGYLKDVGFMTDNTNKIMTMNFDHEINHTRADAQSKNGFTTMRDNDNTATEGYSNITNIGSIGNNGYITGLAPPPPPTDPPIQPAVGYTPLLIDKKPVCGISTVRESDASYNYIKQYGFNYPLAFDNSGKVTKSVPICSPDELYTIQKVVLDQLNSFNREYSDFLTDKYNIQHSKAEDNTPKLPYIYGQLLQGTYANTDNVTQLETYKKLKENVDRYNDLLKANKAYYPDPDQGSKSGISSMDPIVLDDNHRNMVKMRNDLDAKLFELNNTQNSAAGEKKMQMDGSIYVTILWTTLATSILYFMLI